jgi:hypothetical protein
MAETTEREASKLRLLKMAEDYESRIGSAPEATAPAPAEATDATEEPTVETAPENPVGRRLQLRKTSRAGRDAKAADNGTPDLPT